VASQKPFFKVDAPSASLSSAPTVTANSFNHYLVSRCRLGVASPLTVLLYCIFQSVSSLLENQSIAPLD
jgi:hypothetical protein